MSNIIDRRIFFTELKRHNQEERVIAERYADKPEPTAYQNGLMGYIVDETDKDDMTGFYIFEFDMQGVEYDDYPLDEI